MKIKGQTLSELNEEEVIFNRPKTPIRFIVRAVLTYDEFEKLVPQIEVPKMLVRGSKEPKLDFDNPAYLKKIDERSKLLTYWLLIWSIKDTEELEFEHVKLDTPSTWPLVEKELQDAKLTKAERNYLLGAVMRVNSVTEEAIEKGRQRFFEQQRAEQEESTSQQAEQ